MMFVLLVFFRSLQEKGTGLTFRQLLFSKTEVFCSTTLGKVLNKVLQLGLSVIVMWS